MWYLVLSRASKPKEEVFAQISNHLAWMQTQHQAGNVLFSGPSIDRSIGIYIVRADSLSAAQEIVATDPFHAQELREAEIIQWEVHQIMGSGPFAVDAMAALGIDA